MQCAAHTHTHTRMLANGILACAPCRMAPEVLANQRYSSKADIYSFGVVAWECCARQVPYEGMNGVQAALAVVNRCGRTAGPAGLRSLHCDFAALALPSYPPIHTHTHTRAQTRAPAPWELPPTRVQVTLHTLLAMAHRGLRPAIPAHAPAALADLTRACWAPVPEQRPTFDQVQTAARV